MQRGDWTEQKMQTVPYFCLGSQETALAFHVRPPHPPPCTYKKEVGQSPMASSWVSSGVSALAPYGLF